MGLGSLRGGRSRIGPHQVRELERAVLATEHAQGQAVNVEAGRLELAA